MLETITPLKTFVMGAGLVLISGKFWVFTMSAIGMIEEAQLGQPSSTVAFLIFIFAGSVIAPARHPYPGNHPWKVRVHPEELLHLAGKV